MQEWERIYACWLCNFPDIGNGKLHQLSELCGGPEGVYYASKEKWRQILSEKQVASLAEYTAAWRPREEYQKMRQRGIRLVNFWQEDYPKRLKDIPDPPYGLFVKGQLPKEDVPTVAVIGARECSEYGRHVAMQLGYALGRSGVAVISGMARGVDGITQEAALEAGGGSVGVLGSGVDICYPTQNRGLYNRLAQSGAVVSSYPLGTPALARNFPPRNRIVSGLADAVVVIEARVKSGTLITVDMALEQGKDVYVVPGRVTDLLSEGCNRLIKQGAGVILSPEEFVKEFWELWVQRNGGGIPALGIPDRGTSAPGIPKSLPDDSLPPHLEKILPPEIAETYKVLDYQPRTAEELWTRLPGKYQNVQIAPHLMRLCMEKLAVQVSPGRFCRR